MTVLVPSIFVAYAVSYPQMILKTARALDVDYHAC